MRSRSALLASLAVTLLVTACGGGAVPSPSGSGAPGSVEGRTFLSTAADGRTLVVGSRVRVSFRAGQVAANAGCNTMSGAYRIESGRLVVTALATTDMACAEPLVAQDRWVADLLDGATITVSGTVLTLGKGSVRVTFLDRVVADPDRPLLGTRWALDGIVAGSAVSSVPTGVHAAMILSDGRAAVEAGCNAGSGAATISGASITFGAIGLTKMACAADAMAVEAAVMAVLSGTVSWSIEASSLTLTAGSNGLILRATP